MARLGMNILSIELTEYIIRCYEKKEDGREIEILNITKYLDGCDLLEAEKIARQALGIPRLTRRQTVSYDAIASRMYRIDTSAIVENAFSVE